MKYVAVFDVPDGWGYGCAIIKACPRDGKIRTDAEHKTIAADLIRKDEYDAPKYLEVPFYRNLVLDHMQISCHMDDRRRKELEDPEKVWEETVRISKARTQKEIQARYAYYFGQLALLDYIKKMQNEYTAPAKQD